MEHPGECTLYTVGMTKIKINQETAYIHVHVHVASRTVLKGGGDVHVCGQLQVHTCMYMYMCHYYNYMSYHSCTMHTDTTIL